jgi:hypothetical protein
MLWADEVDLAVLDRMVVHFGREGCEGSGRRAASCGGLPRMIESDISSPRAVDAAVYCSEYGWKVERKQIMLSFDRITSRFRYALYSDSRRRYQTDA